MKRNSVILNLLVLLTLLLTAATVTSAQTPPTNPVPPGIRKYRLDSAPSVQRADLKINPALVPLQGSVRVVIRLTAPSVADIVIDNDADPAEQRAQLRSLKVTQDRFLNQVKAIDPQMVFLGAVQRVMDAVIVSVDVSNLPQIAALEAVSRINPIKDYELASQNEVVPYVGSQAVQDNGYKGQGIRVAVLDSGIDYTHANLGGSGSVGDFNANNPDIIEPGTFPTRKVIGGYDFVGSNWPNTVEQPDPDPLDKGSGSGHGTHVADIIAGITGVGMAPEALLYAVKVCSSVSTSCSGVALMQAMDFSLDPNGDGRINDHVDIINMSLGSNFGQPYDDDLSYAVNQASAVGILTVAASGNANDIPYITSTPAAAPSALSVAAMEMPSASLQILQLLTPESIAGNVYATYQTWSTPLTNVIQAPVVYGGSVNGNNLGCSAFPPASLAGKIALVDRGSCAISIKVSNMAAAGALVGVVGLVAPGEPTNFSYGGGTPSIPGYNISQADATRIKDQLSNAVNVTGRFDPALVSPLTRTLAGYSSRGPAGFDSYVKPEIAAPCCSVSAETGTGMGETGFSGTSGATPVISGVAAQIKSKYPFLKPLELKALLVNTAETDLFNKALVFGGGAAPISRVGGGEVRAANAALSPALAWTRTAENLVKDNPRDYMSHQPILSFKFQDIDTLWSQFKNVQVRNLTDQPVTYNLSSSFRFADDQENGAISIAIRPARITVPAQGWGAFQVEMTIDPARLREWALNSGNNGNNGSLLTTQEYDGYIWLDNANDPADDGSASMLHLPWHVLPRLSGNVVSDVTSITIDSNTGTGVTGLTNIGAGPGYMDSFSWIATSGQLPPAAMGAMAPVLDLKEIGVATYPVPADFCSADESFILALAINTWNRQTISTAPGVFDIFLDTNQDGAPEYEVLNWDSAFPGVSTGQNLSWVFDLATGRGSAYFYTNQGTNSGNTILMLCGEQIGMNAANFHAIDVEIYSLDIYFTGNVIDSVTGLTLTPFGERYIGLTNDLASGASGSLTVYDTGAAGNPSEKGVLLFLDADRGNVRGGAPIGNEALPIQVIP